MEQSPEENAEIKDEELWDTARSMARGSSSYRLILFGSIAMVAVTLYFFIPWGGAKLWTWQDVCASFAIFYLGWGAIAGLVGKLNIKKSEAIELSQLGDIGVIGLARIILERDLALMSLLFFTGGFLQK
jgi:hypothetical protein